MIEVSPDLLSFLKQEYGRCRDDTLEEERETAIERYNGEPYGDEEEGSSQVVARDTAETIDYMTISILRTLISGERVVEFVHRDADKAHEATETIMHLLMDEQDGYQILHDWLKSGLLEKNAVAMTYPETRQPKRVEMQVPAPLLDQVDAIEAEFAGTDPETGAEIYNVVIKKEQPPKFCDAAVPNEEFYCSPDARTIDEAPLKGRRVRKSISDIIGMGIPREEAEAISSDGYYNDAVTSARDEDRYTQGYDRQGLARQVWWHEDYVRFDENGDGIAELLYVQRSADFKVFSIQELEDEEDHPFVDWCPYPMPHRRVGQSLADKVMDLERINTVVLRQTLDGFYIGNNPSTYLHEDSIGENTIDDILNVRAGRVVRWKGAVAPVERSGTFDPSAGLTMMERLERMRETRTGITRLNMGLDEETLNQTAKGQAQLIARGEQQEEYIARNFANAVAKLITKKAKTLRRYGQPIMVPIDGEYTEVDPTQWPDDMIARARVGLGASRKDQRMALRREVIGMQQAAFEAGLGIVDEQKFYNSAKGFIADANLGDVNKYFNEPPKDEQGNPLPKQPQPDPEMAKVQAQAQLQAQKQQTEQQIAAAKLQTEQQIAAVKLQTDQQRAAAELQAVRERASAELDLARAKASAEIGLSREKMFAELELERERMAMQAQMDSQRIANEKEVKLDKNRSGGRLDA